MSYIFVYPLIWHSARPNSMGTLRTAERDIEESRLALIDCGRERGVPDTHIMSLLGIAERTYYRRVERIEALRTKIEQRPVEDDEE